MDKKARKAFLSDFERWYALMFDYVTGLEGAERSNYVFKLFSRSLFLYFVQHQRLLEHNQRYLHDKLEQCQAAGIPYRITPKGPRIHLSKAANTRVFIVYNDRPSPAFPL